MYYQVVVYDITQPGTPVPEFGAGMCLATPIVQHVKARVAWRLVAKAGYDKKTLRKLLHEKEPFFLVTGAVGGPHVYLIRDRAAREHLRAIREARGQNPALNQHW